MEKSNNFKQLSQGRGIKRKFDEAFGSFGIRKEFEGIENGKRTRNTDSGFDSEMVTVDTDTEAEDMAEEQMEMVTMDTDTEAEDTAEKWSGKMEMVTVAAEEPLLIAAEAAEAADTC